MANANATVSILVSLRDGVTSQLKGIRGAITATFGGLRGLVAGGLGVAFANAVKNVGLAQAEMARFAESTGESVEEVSRLKFALSTIGKADGLKELLNQLSGKRADAIRSPGQARTAFGQLGVDIQELRTLGAVEILKQLADGYTFAGDRALAASNLQAIFGDQFREFLPLLSQGREGLDELGRSADKLGATISAEDALNAKEFAKNWAEFEALTSGLFRDLANTLLPTVNEMLRELKALLGDISPEQRRAEASAIASKPLGTILYDLTPEAEATLRSFGGIVESLGVDPHFEQAGIPGGRRSKLMNPDVVNTNIEREKAEQERIKKDLLGGKGGKGSDVATDSFLAGFRDEIKSTNEELEKMANLGAQTARSLQNAFSSNITSAIRAVRTGALSVKDALDSLLDGLLDDIAEFATQELVKRLISAGLSFIGGGGSSGSGGGNTYGDIGTSPPPSISGAGGGGLLSLNGGGGLKRFGGGGTTINVYGAQTAEEQRSTVSAIMRDQIARNRQVRVQLRGV